ncbi:MAG: TlpA family protein disulfide reductase [Candidatus Omnitrophica bacterium]|nr:TlpA family protein disulfide reductase [Candidatus Omnitrophota bacterium]
MKNLIILLICFSFLSSVSALEQKFYTLDGEKVSYEEVTSSPKAVLFLWTTWCPSCLREIAHLDVNPIIPNDVNFFYINLGERKSRVKRTVASLGLTQSTRDKILLDTNGILPEKFFIIGVPTFIFFKKGVPVHRSYLINKQLLREVFENE